MPAITLPPTPAFLPQALTGPSPTPNQGESGGASFQDTLAREMHGAETRAAMPPAQSGSSAQSAQQARQAETPRPRDAGPRPADRSSERNAERARSDDKSAADRADAANGPAEPTSTVPGQPAARDAKQADGKDKSDKDETVVAGLPPPDGTVSPAVVPMFGVPATAAATADAAAAEVVPTGVGEALQSLTRRGGPGRDTDVSETSLDAGPGQASSPATPARTAGTQQALPGETRADAPAAGANPTGAFETRLEQTLAGLAAAAPAHGGERGAPGADPGAAGPAGPADIGGPASLAAVRTAADRPVTTERIETPVTATGWGEALGQKVVWMANRDHQVAELHLSPPDLGPLQVTLSVDRDQATASFVSPHPEVRAAIEAAMPRLRDMLQENGITLGNTSVSPENPRSQDGSPQGRGEPGGRGGQLLRGLAVGGHDGGAVRAGVGLVDTFA